MTTEHRPYLHKEAGESSLRCTCGGWRGAHPVDMDGHAEHVLVTRGDPLVTATEKGTTNDQ